MRWIRRKYEGKHRLGMKELRNRFCDKGGGSPGTGRFTGASSVAVTRYRYRGSNIPTHGPGTGSSPHHRQLTSGKDTWSAGCAERCTPGAGRGPAGNDRRETPTPRPWAYLTLMARFGSDRVFMDVDSIEPGDDFAEVIANAVGSCTVLLAVIGDRWLGAPMQPGGGAWMTPATSSGWRSKRHWRAVSGSSLCSWTRHRYRIPTSSQTAWQRWPAARQQSSAIPASVRSDKPAEYLGQGAWPGSAACGTAATSPYPPSSKDRDGAA